MILLVNDTFSANDTVGMMKTFANDEELWQHIEQRTRLNQIPQEKIEEKWGFTYYPHQTLADFMEHSQERSFMESAVQACEQEQRLIVIHQGRNKPLFLVASPELDTVKLKREWCKAYAKSYRLLIVRE